MNLSATGLTVDLPNGERLFSPLTFDVPKGSFVAVVGPSGVGKSSLLRALVGLQPCTAESLTMLNQDGQRASATDWTRLRRQRLRYVDQDCSLIRELNVRDNIALSLLDGGEDDSAVDLLLDRFGLTERSAATPDEISGGERQRVALARALVTDPDLVICDEPTSFLDSRRAESVCKLLRGEADRGRSVLVATHDPLVVDFADKAVPLAEHG